MSVAEASKSPIVINEVQRAIDEVNKNVSQAESIRKFSIISSELTEESGHITPSLKIKRAQVVKDFAPIIDDLYGTPPSTVDGMKTV
jgi:long-chain acyl-CoA synthetase